MRCVYLAATTRLRRLLETDEMMRVKYSWFIGADLGSARYGVVQCHYGGASMLRQPFLRVAASPHAPSDATSTDHHRRCMPITHQPTKPEYPRNKCSSTHLHRPSSSPPTRLAIFQKRNTNISAERYRGSNQSAIKTHIAPSQLLTAALSRGFAGTNEAIRLNLPVVHTVWLVLPREAASSERDKWGMTGWSQAPRRTLVG